MKNIKILAIESSCDETSIAIVENGKNILAHVTNTQIEKFKNLGGVVPEMASRMHADNIFYVYQKALEEANLSIEDIDAIAVTQGPGLIGSLLVGINFAKTLALLSGKKLIAVNHLHGHIYATNIEENIEFPHLSLIVSGGHTELVYLKENLSFQKVGSTLDDSLGESYDKVARLLKLPYPGGPEIDSLAQKGNSIYELPYPKNDNTLDFSFSGIKSATYNLVNTKKMKNEKIIPEDIAASFQEKVMYVIDKKFANALKIYNPKQCSIVGGVSANSYIRNVIKKKYSHIVIPNLKYTTDNAAMIGVVGYFKYLKKDFIDPKILDAKVDIEL